MKKELLKGLSEEQIQKARKCKTNEELLAMAKEEGVVLTDDQLAAVNGGFCSDTTKKSVCPKCGTEAKTEIHKDSYVELVGYFKCPNCGHKWTDRFPNN